MDERLLAYVGLVCNELTLQEVAAINLSLLFGSFGPHIFGYDKISVLLTEDCGTGFHEETERAIRAILQDRVERRV
jgi:hypothetical protein